MSVDREIAAHYTKDGLLGRILGTLEEMGVAADAASAEDLKPVDEFHVGGVGATKALIDRLELAPGMRVLDIGCGIGGTARLVAGMTGAHVTGIDLTDDYIRTATALSEMVGMGDRTEFHTASATDMPFEDDACDAALMLHVGMNVPDKEALMRETARVLKPGGIFAIYDIMKTGPEPVEYPVPWAAVAKTSFLADLDTYRAAARKAGFSEISSRDRTEIALDFFAEQRRRAQSEGAPALGLHILMGEDFASKVANLVANISAGRVAPTELVLRLD